MTAFFLQPSSTALALSALLAAAIAGLMTSTLAPGVARIAIALRAVDVPGERKLQDHAVPRLGGVAIALGIALGAGGVAMAGWGQWGGGIGRAELVAFAIGTALVFLVGVVDDLVGVSALKKFLVELGAALLIVHAGWRFEVLAIPGLGNVELGMVGDLVVVAWIVGVTNAINLLDGLDGLASGIVTVIAGSFLVYALLIGNPMTVVLMGGVVGACVGFLRHNWAPARIYMGDSGSLTLGFVLAAMSVHSSIKAPAAVAILVPILALGVPVNDTLMVMAVRFLERPKGPFGQRLLRMFSADRQHLHHLLEQHGAKRQRIVGSMWGVALLFCVLALTVALTKSSALGLTLVAVEFLVVLSLRNLGFMSEVRKIAQRQRTQVRIRMIEGPGSEPGDETGRDRQADGRRR